MSNGVEATGTGHFPSRVMAILNLEEVHQTMHWLPDGKAFIISNPPQFANTVLKTHFKGIQLHSFNKSLTQWGFNMKGGAKSFGGSRKNYIFSSPLFLRDQPELCKSMVRMTKKNWKASRERKCKPKSMKPVASQTEVQMEPEQSEKQPSIPQLQPRAPQISVPVFMSIVPVPMWPMQAVNLPGQPYCPIPPQRSNLEMMHQLSSAREQYVDRQVPLARHIDTRTEPLKKACSIDQPRASKDIVTIRKQNTKVPLSKSELNAAIAMSMLDEVE